ncbi:MAG: caspase family protein [Geminicoccales bacterium]
MNFSDLTKAFCKLVVGSMIIIGMFAKVSWAGDGRRVALVIGNGAYANIPLLENPTHDAALIARKLRDLGFAVDLAIDGDRSSFVQQVRLFGESARGADAALFYYAGHGIQADGQNYLLPVDAEISRLADLRHESLPLAAVMDELDHAGAEINLLILDACRDNPLTRSLASSHTRTAEIAQGLALVQRASGTIIAYATAPGEVAYDGDGQRNSPFTQALSDWIDKPDLDVALMFRRVREQVVAATNGEQVPWVEEAILGNFYFQQDNPKIQPATTTALPSVPSAVMSETAASRSDIVPEATEKPSERPKSAHGPVIRIIEGDSDIPGLF